MLGDDLRKTEVLDKTMINWLRIKLMLLICSNEKSHMKILINTALLILEGQVMKTIIMYVVLWKSLSQRCSPVI